MSDAPLYKTDLKSLPFLHRGKVRDIYAVGDNKLLVVQSDRLSAFDVILDDPIPGKGRVLTDLSCFWFDKLKHIIPNHLTGIDPATVVAPEERAQIAGRAMVVHKYKPLIVEAVVRGYIIGSGWSDYQATGAICGIKLPAGLKQAEKLVQPLFTPASKAPAGHHDENITYDDVVATVSAEHAAKVKEISIQLYNEAAAFAATRGIIIADTKFEFGADAKGNIILIDEALTPDSSRFWPAAEYRTGISPPSFDKQFVRDWLETQPWNKTAPAPRLPADVLKKTSEKYREAQTMLLGN